MEVSQKARTWAEQFGLRVQKLTGNETRPRRLASGIRPNERGGHLGGDKHSCLSSLKVQTSFSLSFVWLNVERFGLFSGWPAGLPAAT